jgi:hypothetical protein
VAVKCAATHAHVEQAITCASPAIFADITLHIVRRNGRKVEVAEGSLDQAEFERFLELARRIRARLKVPIETVSLPSSGPGIPAWWNTRA